MISRVNLHDMHQDREETVRSFYARLKGQANTCNFSISCSECQHAVNYSEHIIRDILIKGIADPDIQLDLLGTITPEMTLERVIKFIEAKEAGKRSVSKLNENQIINSRKSSYRQTKNQNFKDKPPAD